jgi:hypothetical protein
MGRKREAVRRLACGTCGAAGFDPCLHRISGKPLKSFHMSRAIEGRNDHLNKVVSQIDRNDFEEMMQWWAVYLNLDGKNGYHGEF